MATYNIEDIGGKANARYFKKMEDVALDYCPYQIPSEATAHIKFPLKLGRVSRYIYLFN